MRYKNTGIITISSALLFLQLIVSCNPGDSVIADEMWIYNTSSFFKDEANKLNDEKAGLKKILDHGGKQETIIVDTADWEYELTPFINLDINKPALVNSYTIDSSMTNGTGEIVYTAKDSSVSVKKLFIKFSENNPGYVMAVTSEKNMYYVSTDTLEYFRGGRYVIKSMSKPRLGKNIQFTLQGFPVN